MPKYYFFYYKYFGGGYAEADWMEPFTTGEAPTCNACGDYIGMREWLPPYRVKFTNVGKGSKSGDIVFGLLGDLLVSDKFIAVWEREGLKGIVEWRQVEVVRPPKNISKYYIFKRSPRKARLDYKKTKIIWSKHGPPTCAVCYSAGIDGIENITLLEEFSPDADLFSPIGLNCDFVSERFKRVMENAELKNIELFPADKLVWKSGVKTHIKG